MGADETAILQYLKTYPHQFVSVKQIARKATARKRFDKDPHWAIPVLARMVRDKLLDTNNLGGYCFKPEESRKHGEDTKFSKKTEEAIKKASDEAHGAELDAGHPGETQKPG